MSEPEKTDPKGRHNVILISLDPPVVITLEMEDGRPFNMSDRMLDRIQEFTEQLKKGDDKKLLMIECDPVMDGRNYAIRATIQVPERSGPWTNKPTPAPGFFRLFDIATGKVETYYFEDDKAAERLSAMTGRTYRYQRIFQGTRPGS